MATQTPPRYGAARGAAALLVFYLAALVFVAAAGAASPTSSHRGPMTPAPAAVPADTPATAPAAAAAPATAALAASSAKLGLCQCISDRQALDFTCPGSAQACQSSCGQHFAFSPQVECRIDRH
jgi:hypothetical protein